MAITNSLHGFCYYIVHKYSNPGTITEEQKVDEFQKMYVMELPVNLKDIRAVALCCDIKVDVLGRNRSLLQPQINRIMSENS